MKRILLLAPLLAFLAGCAVQPPPPQLNVYMPTDLPAGVKIVRQNNVPFAVWESEKYKVSAALYEYKNTYAAQVEITNKTNTDIATNEYFINLVDGRDKLPFNPVPLKTLSAIKDNIKDDKDMELNLDAAEKKLAETAISLFRAEKPNDAPLVKKGIDMILDNYFAFRPIWAKETRKGLIAYLLDFRLEYPIMLTFNIKGEMIDFKFVRSKEGVTL